jgi:hypothetical protein
MIDKNKLKNKKEEFEIIGKTTFGFSDLAMAINIGNSIITQTKTYAQKQKEIEKKRLLLLKKQMRY